MEYKILSVSEITNRIATLFDSDSSLLNVCVSGELSNYKIYPSGHHYFVLKDKESSIKCVMFSSYASRLTIKPSNGLHVNVFGRIAVYKRDGVYQIYCTRMIPIGEGEILKEFEKLKNKLFELGWCDEKIKKPLPKYPKSIVIVTSEAGAAVHDMLRILRSRWPAAKISIISSKVQGSEAPFEIARAIKTANRLSLGELIIIGRGGGSFEDLNAFNSEIVAEAVHSSKIPVVSAVGHEPDYVISDFVADFRAATPSNAAELCVPDVLDVRFALKMYGVRLNKAYTGVLSGKKNTLERYKGLKYFKDMRFFVDDKKREVDYMSNRLLVAFSGIYNEKYKQFIELAAAVDALSPLKVLARGYSLATKPDGSMINSINSIEASDVFTLRLADGTAECTVNTINAVTENTYG